jgi:phosphoribosylanthranilate isomerase
MLGFVFYEPSHRYLEPQQAQALCASAINRGPSRHSLPDLAGVFVNKDTGFINDVAEQVGLHFVQLHGHESPEFCQQIKRPVLKALHLDTSEDKGMIKAYRETTWRILLDTPTPVWGGTGVTHDWSLAHNIATEIPIMLAGGLTPENVAEAISQVRPWGIDVSSGVETNKQKDVTKIRTFIENARKER